MNGEGVSAWPFFSSKYKTRATVVAETGETKQHCKPSRQPTGQLAAARTDATG